MCERETKGIDGFDSQQVRISKDIPALFFSVLERRSCEIRRFIVAVSRGLHGLENPAAHFGSGRACEGDCEDLFWRVDLAEKSQESLSEQFRFARACRGLHDERGPGVESQFARGCICEYGWLNHWSLPLRNRLFLARCRRIAWARCSLLRGTDR